MACSSADTRRNIKQINIAFMNNGFLVTTTGYIEGGHIRKYIDVVSCNVVMGTNIFSDIAASFRDILGGRSASYKEQLEEAYEGVMEELVEKARQVGANALVGVKIDFDEISGGNKSMFMVSAVGTACDVCFD